jgi:hypothetical protein
VTNKCNPIKLSKEFLLTLVAYVDQGLYKNFYNSEEIKKRIYNKWSDYDVVVDKNLIDDINNFIPIQTSNKRQGGFRIYKNHQNTNVFTEARNVGLHNNQNQNQKQVIGNQLDQINNLKQINLQNINKINLLEQQLKEQSEKNQQLNHMIENDKISINNDMNVEGRMVPNQIPSSKNIHIKISKRK